MSITKQSMSNLNNDQKQASDEVKQEPKNEIGADGIFKLDQVKVMNIFKDIIKGDNPSM